ncbi:MAG TPA: MFS transporter [Acidimicrobiales bacterium]|nr:MFS transporter [Acidimicrobiales bacterium]
MPLLVTNARVARQRVPELLAAREGLVVEERQDDGSFLAVNGPVEGYRRMITVIDTDDTGEVDVHQVVEYRLVLPFLRWMLGRAYARSLGALGSPLRHPWWAPPEPIDPRAAAMLGALCALAAVAAYPGVVLGQTIEFAREELGFTSSAQSYALAILRADFVVALFVVYLADRHGRRKVALSAIAAGCLVNAVSAISPSLEILVVSQVVGRGFLTGAAVLIGILAAEEMPAGCRAYAVSLLTLVGAVGAGAALLALPLADLGPRAWRLLFVLSLIGLPLVFVFGQHLPESRRFAKRHANVRMSGHHRRLWLLGISALLFGLFLAPASQYQTVFLRRERGFSASRISLFVIATNIWGGIGIVAGGRLADVRGRRRVAAVGIVGGVGCTVAMFFAAGWTIWAWSVVGSVIGAVTVPALGVYGPELFPTSLRGRANGIISGLGRIGSVLGLVVIALLVRDDRPLAPIVALLAVGPALLAVLVLTAYPETAHRELEELNPEDATPIASGP